MNVHKHIVPANMHLELIFKEVKFKKKRLTGEKKLKYLQFHKNTINLKKQKKQLA